MVWPTKPKTTPAADDPLAERIRELRAEQDRLFAEGIDPDDEVDRIAEELFGSPRSDGRAARLPEGDRRRPAR